MANERFLLEVSSRGGRTIKKAEQLLAELLEEHGNIENIPSEKMKEVHRLASSGGGFLNSKGEILQYHPH